jgi:hypothetical protein
LQLASTFCRPGRDSLKITAQLNNPDNHDVQVVAKIFSIDSAFVDSTNMYDDGFHFDGQARDGQFGGCVKPLSIENEFFVRANSMDFNMGKNHLSAETARFTTIGPVVVESYRILSSDTLINPGAVVPLQFALKNNGATAIAKNIKTKISSLHNDSIRFAGYPSFGDIAAGETSVTTGTNVFILPKDFPANKNIFIKVEIFSSEFLFWLDTLQFFIYPTLVQNNSQQPPLEFALFQNYPNPFNSRTTISYQLPACGFVELTVYNINGQKISTLVARQQQAGYYHLEWDASDLPSGSYFYNLKTGSYNEMKKMTLQK